MKYLPLSFNKSLAVKKMEMKPKKTITTPGAQILQGFRISFGVAMLCLVV